MSNQPKELNVLIVEDSEEDAFQIVHELRLGGYVPSFERVENGKEMRVAVKGKAWDIIISDFNIPEFSSYAALEICRETELEVPFIVVSDPIGEEKAVEIIKAGADGYVLKNNISRLVPVLMRELSQRIELEDQYKREKENLDILTENAPFGLVTVEKDGKFSYINPKFTEITGYVLSDVSSGKEWFKKAYPDESYRHEVISSWLNDLENAGIGEQRPHVFSVTCKDGTQKIINFIPVLLKGGRNIVTIEDITPRNRAEDALLKSEEKYRGIFENAVMGIFRTTPDGRYLSINPAGARMYGYESQEEMMRLVKDMAYQVYVHPEDRKRLKDLLESSGFIEGFEAEQYTRDGSRIWTSMNARVVRGTSGAILYYETTSENITQRKRVEEALKKSEENYRSIFENAAEGIFQTTPEGRLMSLNPAMARMHGFASAEEMLKEISSINEQLILRAEEGKRYIRTLLQEGRTRQFETEVRRRDGDIIWVSINARVVKDAAGNILRYEGTTQDITERKKAEEELKVSTSKLRKSLIGTIDVISIMLETRDPYTAGHQRRVSGLARSMAQELGLNRDLIDSIRMAGNIHDIGKISVPGDILVRPGKLSDMEMNLMKMHPQTGYEILKVVDLPPPIAKIILQHHERLDGSGYPQGLKAGEIILEAQIIGVADVVEAMVSHRPYRPSRGLKAALEEIERNRGILYHHDVVDVCLRLFREKGFVFEPNET